MHSISETPGLRIRYALSPSFGLVDGDVRKRRSGLLSPTLSG